MASRWLGELPFPWRAGRLSHIARAWPSNVDKHAVEGEMPVRLCNYTDVYKNDAIAAGMDFMPATATPDQVERFRLVRGDTIITKDSETADDIGVPAFVEQEAPDLICGYHLAIVRPDQARADPKFLFWVLGSEPILRQWLVVASGVTRVGIRSTDLGKVAVPRPPLDEQRAIADFLDREVAQIDMLIMKQEQLITSLRERRVAFVTEQLATFPRKRIKSLIDPERPLTYGIIQAGPSVPDGVPYVGPSDMPGDGQAPRLSELRRTSPEIADAYQRSMLRPGDVVASIGPAYGKVMITSCELDGANLTQDTARIACDPAVANPEYVAWALGSTYAREYWDLSIAGATFRRLNLGTLGSTPIPLPDLLRQRQVAGYLDEQAAETDALIGKAGRFIELSKERRAALITAAVTGQVDVGAA